MKKFLFTLGLLLTILPMAASATPMDDKDRAVMGFAHYCYNSLINGKQPGDVARQEKLPVMTPKQLTAFNQPFADAGYVLDVKNLVLLTTSKEPMCGVIVRELDREPFMALFRQWTEAMRLEQVAVEPHGGKAETYSFVSKTKPIMVGLTTKTDGSSFITAQLTKPLP